MNTRNEIDLNDDPEENPFLISNTFALDHRVIVTVKGQTVLNLSLREMLLHAVANGGHDNNYGRETRLDLL